MARRRAAQAHDEHAPDRFLHRRNMACTPDILQGFVTIGFTVCVCGGEKSGTGVESVKKIGNSVRVGRAFVSVVLHTLIIYLFVFISYFRFCCCGSCCLLFCCCCYCCCTYSFVYMLSCSWESMCETATPLQKSYRLWVDG